MPLTAPDKTLASIKSILTGGPAGVKPASAHLLAAGFSQGKQLLLGLEAFFALLDFWRGPCDKLSVSLNFMHFLMRPKESILVIIDSTPGQG
jgi:hypothetical protein